MRAKAICAVGIAVAILSVILIVALRGESETAVPRVPPGPDDARQTKPAPTGVPIAETVPKRPPFQIFSEVRLGLLAENEKYRLVLRDLVPYWEHCTKSNNDPQKS